MSNPGKSYRATESRIRILPSIIRVSADVLKTIQKTKHIPARDWSYALFSKMTDGSRAVLALLRAGLPQEAKLLIRANWDAFIDLFCLLHDPANKARTRDLLELMENTAIEDSFDQLEFMAERAGEQPSRYIKHWDEAEEIYRRHKFLRRRADAENQQAARKRKRGEREDSRPIFWRDLSKSFRMEALKTVEQDLAAFGYTIKTLGNASAHSRPAVLFLHLPGTDLRKFRHTVLGSLYSKEFVAFEACYTLVMACARMAECWYLDEYDGRLNALIDRLYRSRPIR